MGLFLVVADPAQAGKRLAEADSPYLRAHAKDAVDWHPWGPEAFALAKKEGKPIFLSIGYLACHWCHVMQQESFRNPDTAALINTLYVPVLVDREQRPDIDAQMIRAANLMGLPTGWPLNVFLTPEGFPYYAGTYFPPVSIYGMPSFREVASRSENMYRSAAADMPKLAAKLRRVFHGGRGGPTAPVSAGNLQLSADVLVAELDDFNGGFGLSPKFPLLPALEFLWRTSLRMGDPVQAQVVVLSLESMAVSGLYDHLGGGFHRYTTDAEWRKPHFEKMLNDNALFVRAMTEVWRDIRSPLLHRRIGETVDFMLRDLRLPDGTFATSLDADVNGLEGAYYLWSAAEIREILGRNADLFIAAYGITEEGDVDGKNVLRQAATPDSLAAAQNLTPEEVAGRLVIAREALREARAKRPAPQRDDKVLADWNSLAIIALAEAGVALDKPQWIGAAERTFDRLMSDMVVNGLVRHSRARGNVGGLTTLADQARLAQAALTLYDVTGTPRYKQEAIRLADGARRFIDKNGGYIDAPAPEGSGLPPTKTANDGPEAPGNAVIADVHARLYYLTGVSRYREMAEKALTTFMLPTLDAPIYHAGILNAADTLLAGTQVVIVGKRGEPGTEALLEAVFARPLPGRVLQVVAPDEDLPKGHPAMGKNEDLEVASIFICVGSVCTLPINDPERVAPVTARMLALLYPDSPAAKRYRALDEQEAESARQSDLDSK
ncbi:MAG: thioredoxin domain-containing protein [Magnetospiraceae bacterium]